MNAEAGKQFVIDVNVSLSDEMMEYIIDCWVEFVICDLGFEVRDMPIVYG